MGRKSYLFDLGNSNVGPIGLAMRVTAPGRSEAVDIAREVFRSASGDCGHIDVRLPDEAREGIEYVTIFVNPDAITEADISEEDQ
jgi:hypothetical protein